MYWKQREYEYFLRMLKQLVNGPPYFGAIHVEDVERMFTKDVGLERLRTFLKRMFEDGEIEYQDGMIIFPKIARKIGRSIVEREDNIKNDLSVIAEKIRSCESCARAAESLRKIWSEEAPTPDIGIYSIEFWSRIVRSYRQDLEELFKKREMLYGELQRLESIKRRYFGDLSD